MPGPFGKFGPIANPITAQVGKVYSSHAYLFSGTRLGMQIINAEASGTGNDVALDDISLLDMTPRLALAFETPEINPGQTSPLRLTVVNSADRAEKDGWGYTIVLPAGLELADDPGFENFCTDRGSSGFTPGATRFTIKGLLSEKSPNCSATVQVKATTRGSKAIAPGTGVTSLIGLHPTAPATLTVS